MYWGVSGPAAREKTLSSKLKEISSSDSGVKPQRYDFPFQKDNPGVESVSAARFAEARAQCRASDEMCGTSRRGSVGFSLARYLCMITQETMFSRSGADSRTSPRSAETNFPEKVAGSSAIIRKYLA